MMESLSESERIILEGVAFGMGQWNWYDLTNYLSVTGATVRPSLMPILKMLVARGLVTRFTGRQYSLGERWELTAAGETLIEQLQAAQA